MSSDPKVSPAYYEHIAAELEFIAEMLRDKPELNHHAAERLLAIARDIRSDVARLVGCQDNSSPTN